VSLPLPAIRRRETPTQGLSTFITNPMPLLLFFFHRARNSRRARTIEIEREREKSSLRFCFSRAKEQKGERERERERGREILEDSQRSHSLISHTLEYFSPVSLSPPFSIFALRFLSLFFFCISGPPLQRLPLVPKLIRPKEKMQKTRMSLSAELFLDGARGRKEAKLLGEIAAV
jgi:hypothetical protein